MPNRPITLCAAATLVAVTLSVAGCALLPRPNAPSRAPGAPNAPASGHGIDPLAADLLPGEWESVGVAPMRDDPAAVACLGDERAVLADATVAGGVISGYMDVDRRFYVRQTVYPSADHAADLAAIEQALTGCFGQLATRDSVLNNGSVIEERGQLMATALDLPEADFAYEGGRMIGDTVTLFLTAWYATQGEIAEVEIDYPAGAEPDTEEFEAILAPFEAQLP